MPSSSITTIGYIGLGNAGYPMASNLARAGYNMVVRDADPAREQKFVDEFTDPAKPGAISVADKAAGTRAFEAVQILITMLPNGKVVKDVLLGENGVALGLKSGTIIVDTSSSSPYDTRALGALLSERDLPLIDSPITQTHLHAIDDAGATLMIGCSSPAALDTALPVLKAMSKYTYVMGELGAGHAMKTLNNYVSVGSILALCDALVAGQKFGLDPGTMIDVLNVGTGRNFSTAYSFRDEALPRRFASGYALSLLVKDVGIAKELIDNMDIDSKLPALAQEYLSEALKLVKPNACHEECVKLWEKKAGIELKKTPLPEERVADETAWKA